jgi:hypothetical protein
VYRRAAFAALLCLTALSGCARPGPVDAERSVRDGMKAQMGIDVAAVNVTRQPDGSFAGTATAANGDVYNVRASVSGDGWSVLQVVLADETIERMIRDHLATNMQVAATEVKKQSDGGFTGTATATNGTVYEVSASAPTARGIALNATLAQPTIENRVRADIEAKLDARVKGFALTRHGPCHFTGTATLTDGTLLDVETHLEGAQLVWSFGPMR